MAGKEVFTVEKILDKTMVKGKPMYKTKWLGYEDPEDITWEPLSSFQPPARLVKQFEIENVLAKGFVNDLINELGQLPPELLEKKKKLKEVVKPKVDKKLMARKTIGK
ncbi:Chromo domain-containing protein [Aphelenchoides bicaudatus]|nr:Chromo domain-containing protein [Aphelenchoides bicaudatus]